MSSSRRDHVLSSGTKEVRFRHWPLRQQPWRSLALVVLGVAATVLLARVTGQVWAGIAAGVALALSFWRMWLPVDFEFGPRGVVQTYLGRQRRVAWRDIARCEFQRHGLLLHATEDATALGLMRSIYVRYPAQRDQLCDLVEFEMARSTFRPSSSSVETIRRQVVVEETEPPVSDTK